MFFIEFERSLSGKADIPLLFLLRRDKHPHDDIHGDVFLPPGTPLDGTHFCKNRPISNKVSNPQSGHAYRMSCLQCDLPEILEQTGPRDPKSVDLIEKAFLEEQIDSRKAELAYLWILVKSVICAK